MRVSHRSLLWVKEGLAEDVGDGTKWPVGLTRGQLSEWIFRVKRLSFDLPAASGSGNHTHPDGIDSADVSDPWSFTASGGTVEQEEPDAWRSAVMAYTGDRMTLNRDQQAAATGILSEPGAGGLDNHGYTWDPIEEEWVRYDDPTKPVDVDIAAELLAHLGPDGGEPVLLVDGLFYPPFTLTTIVSCTAISVGISVSSDWEAFPVVDDDDDFTDTAVSLSATFLGVPLTLQGRARIWDADGYDGAAGFSGELTINAVEWRDYGGLWDTATGAYLGGAA